MQEKDSALESRIAAIEKFINMPSDTPDIPTEP
jgi:hypothetical protein